MYYFQLAKNRTLCNLIKSYNDKKSAIKHAKLVALDEKCSVVIYRTVGEDLVFIGVVEYPYHLRFLALDESDLTLSF